MNGIAKKDAGCVNRFVKVIDGGPPIIEEGREYGLTDNYNFNSKGAIFKPVPKKDTKKEVIK